METIVAVTLSIACSVAALIVLVAHWRSGVDEDASFAILLVATVLVSGHTSVYDLVILAPALLVVADRLLFINSDDPQTSVRRAGWILLSAAYLLQLWSTAAVWLRVQPMVICLTVLLCYVSKLGRWTADARPSRHPRSRPDETNAAETHQSVPVFS